MVMSKWFPKTVVLFLMVFGPFGNSITAQVLLMLNSYNGRTFNGTVEVSRPVEFNGCVFITDSVVLHRSYGAVFRNCTFESRTGVLYMVDEGDGIILSDCDVTGCKELRFSRKPSVADRNYINGVRLNGEECSVLDEQEGIIDIDGLELSESVNGVSGGPLIMRMTADNSSLKSGDTALITVRGLDNGMFVGWQSSDPSVNLSVESEFSCKVIVPAQIIEEKVVVISAYTEYGLEAACSLTLMPDELTAASGKKVRKKKK